MILLTLGLIVFLGIHLVPVFPGLRNGLYAKYGEKGYKGRFSILSGIGFALLIVGYAMAPAAPRVFDPVPGARHATLTLMTLVFILLAAGNMKGYIRAKLRHPMLLGVLLWAGLHFLANGSLRDTVLFGAFFAWALVDLVSAIARGAVKQFTPQGKYDAMAVVGGFLVAHAFMWLHGVLIGVRIVPWGL